jgi:hypothetical protein
MELDPSWEAATYATTQKHARILQNPKFYYRVHKSPTSVPALSHIDPVNTTPLYLSNIHFNTDHPPTFWSYK